MFPVSEKRVSMMKSHKSGRIGDQSVFQMPGHWASAGRLSELLGGLLIVIVIIVLLLSQEDPGVGMAL